MKSVIILLFSLLFIVSCGEKKDSGKVGFKILLGRALDGSDRFQGGLLIMGRYTYGGHSFVLRYTPDLELTLPKGPWEFAAIGWESSTLGMMTGNHLCSYAKLELRDDQQTVSFPMSSTSCLNAQGIGGEEFSDTQFMLQAATGSSTPGFKKLVVKICDPTEVAAGNCGYGYLTQSIKIGIIPDVKNLPLPSTVPALVSDCLAVNSGSSTISTSLRIPYGGEKGFLHLKVEAFSDTTCSTYRKNFSFPHGFTKNLSTVAIMSPNDDPAINYRFLGSFDSTSAPSTALAGDIYYHLGSNQYKMYNNSAWGTLPTGVSVSNGRVFDMNSDPHLFLAE